MVALGVLAVVLAHALWRGVNVAFTIAGVILWIAALEAVEGISQEVDHPDRLSSAPEGKATLVTRHLAGAALGLAPFALAAAGASVALAPDRMMVVAAVCLALPITAACGAAVSIVKGPPPPPTAEEIMFPEAAGARMVVNALTGPVICALALAPVALAWPGSSLAQPEGLRLLALNASIGAVVFAATVCWLHWHFRAASQPESLLLRALRRVRFQRP